MRIPTDCAARLSKGVGTASSAPGPEHEIIRKQTTDRAVPGGQGPQPVALGPRDMWDKWEN